MRMRQQEHSENVVNRRHQCQYVLLCSLLTGECISSIHHFSLRGDIPCYQETVKPKTWWKTFCEENMFDTVWYNSWNQVSRAAFAFTFV